MAVQIRSNISSLVTQRRLNIATQTVAQGMERLSSGLRINTAADDAAGLAIASNLSADSRVFAQGIRNINDGISALNVAEGALQQLANIVVRQAELSEQAINGVYSSAQRQALNSEAAALTSEYNRIVQSTAFNGRYLLDGSFSESRIQGGYSTNGGISVSIDDLSRVTIGFVGDGTLATPSSIGTNSGQSSIATGDFNSDGYIDIVTTSATTNKISVALGNGNGTFTAAKTFATSASGIEAVQVGDFNNDSIADVMAFGDSNSRTSIWLGNGNGTFLASLTFSGGDDTAAAADLNGDNILDIVTNTYATNRLNVSIGNGNGTFLARVTYQGYSSDVREFALGDMNGDGKIDIVSSTSTANFTVTLGNGNGTFMAWTAYSAGSGAATRGVPYLADLNGDNRNDIVIVDQTANVLRVALQTAGGSFSTGVSYASGSGLVQATGADFNNDGYIDLISANSTAGTATILLNNGNGTFTAPVAYTAGTTPSFGTIADFNEDGVNDYAVANSGDSTLSMFLGGYDTVVTQVALNLTTVAGAQSALTYSRTSLDNINSSLGRLGSYQSRLLVAANNLFSSKENYQAAASQITDIDAAVEAANFTKASILQQVTTGVLTQANQQPSLALKLLQGI